MNFPCAAEIFPDELKRFLVLHTPTPAAPISQTSFDVTILHVLQKGSHVLNTCSHTHSVEHAGFVASNSEGHVAKFGTQKALKLIA